MFWFIKKCFFVLPTFLTSVNSLNCISMAKVRPEIITVNSNDPVFYPFSIKQVNVVGSGSCNNVNDPYAKICVPDDVKDLKMPRTNETGHIKWHETCKCKCRLDCK